MDQTTQTLIYILLQIPIVFLSLELGKVRGRKRLLESLGKLRTTEILSLRSLPKTEALMLKEFIQEIQTGLKITLSALTPNTTGHLSKKSSMTKSPQKRSSNTTTKSIRKGKVPSMDTTNVTNTLIK